MKKAETALDLPALVRERDYRRFLAIQFARPAERPALYALTAFSTEMAHIPQHVNEPLAGFMRYAWWREALAEMQQGQPPRGHPLLQALAPELIRKPEMFAHLDTLITTGQQQLENPEDKAPRMAREEALDALWILALEGPGNKPLQLLKSLPLKDEIGPWQIFKLICKSLKP